MKSCSTVQRVALAALWLSLLPEADAAIAQPRTFCRFVPERLDDFASENDKISNPFLKTDLKVMVIDRLQPVFRGL